MTQQEFELDIAQVETVIKSCRSKFKSERKQGIYNNLLELFYAVKTNYRRFNINELLFCRYNILHFVHIGIEFLDYKSVKEIPAQLLKCLEMVLKEWLDNPEFFCVVFSGKNKVLREFYTWALDENDINVINRGCNALKLGVNYDHGLIHISQPQFFNTDFLSSIPVYHELGHFIDANYMIAKEASSNDFIYNDISISFRSLDDKIKIKSYLSEHFCDIFAAQYIGHVMSEVLNFVARDEPPSEEHPSTKKRIDIIETFISGSGSANNLEIVNFILNATRIQTLRKGNLRELKNRVINISKDPFTLNKPVSLNDHNEFHSLIADGWYKFMGPNEFTLKFPDPTQRKNRINKLIRRSIDLSLRNQKWLSLFTTK